MGLYAIGDLHLSLSVNKPMDIFAKFERPYRKLRASFRNCGMMIPLCCAGTRPGEFVGGGAGDFRFLDRLPGRKILLKGNHDYWWRQRQNERLFAEHKNEIHTLQLLHNCFIKLCPVCGTRGWFSDEETPDMAHNNRKVLNREAMRLKHQ